MSIWRYANPAEFMRITSPVMTPLWILSIATLGLGLGWALFFTPPDYQQGETVRIMFVHVPAAWMALACYSVMALASAVGIIWRWPKP